MHWTHISLRLACGLILLTGAGCYSYSPYGAGGYPGVYSVPPGGSAPYQGGAAPYQGGTQLGPPSSLPSQSQAVPEYDPQAQTFDNGSQGTNSFDSQNGQNDAPLYEPPQKRSGGSGSPAPRDDDNAVPDYQDPNSYSEPLPSDDDRNGASNGRNADGGEQADQRNSESTDPELDADDAESPFNSRENSGASLNGGGEFADEAALGSSAGEPEAFKPPVKVQPAAATRTLVETSASTGARGPDPYAYDSQGYRWLRGVAHYDEQDDSWQLIYSLNPSADDEFGGSITLKDHPRLRGLPDESVVLVEGRVDRQERDTFGKPQYHVERLARLTPGQR